MPKKTTINADDEKLAKERMALEKLIQKEILKAWEDPSVESYFKMRVEKEEAQRHLEELKHKNEALETEYVHLVDAVMERLPTSELPSTDFDRISKMTSQFQERKQKVNAMVELGQVMDSQWRHHCDNIAASLFKTPKGVTKEVTERIQQDMKALQRQLDENFRQQLEKFLENKLEKQIESNSKKLRKLINEPINELTEQIVQRARKVDATEDMAIKSMYKVANFLNKGEFDISFWQKMNILSTNFKQYFDDYSKSTNRPKSLEKLCLDVKGALEKGDPESVSELIQRYFESENKKMETALAEVEEAIDNAMKKDGEQFVEELLVNAENELSKKSPLYKNAKKIGTMARRADTVISYFQANTGEKEEPKKPEKPTPHHSDNKNDTKRKRPRDTK